jgi:Cft2 family RNA processing exonuclease
VPLGEVKQIAPGLSYKTYDAGHILGSTSMIVEADGLRLGYSGDVGRSGLPIIRDPQPLGPCDYLILESTYGDRIHAQLGQVAETLAAIINRTAGRGGKIIVPAFAVGRTQQLVLILHQLMNAHRIPSIPVFVDSPLAINVTEVFRKHPECFDEEVNRFLTDGQDPFGFRRLTYVREVSESKKLNDLHGPCVIISASGMCEAGRILHHLRNNIEDPRNTVLITGFQAEHTLGRKILEKRAEVPIRPWRRQRREHHGFQAGRRGGAYTRGRVDLAESRRPGTARGGEWCSAGAFHRRECNSGEHDGESVYHCAALRHQKSCGALRLRRAHRGGIVQQRRRHQGLGALQRAGRK